ncbi:MAG: hypothetical protein AT710_01110 [Thermocladium sp. ECH_B]|jgi:MarR family.|nr:MAG: hypothetical protein AT710_01110 [Thermocladium sp. ECH_B]
MDFNVYYIIFYTSRIKNEYERKHNIFNKALNERSMSGEDEYGELDENESKILIALIKLGNQYNQRDLWRMAGINSKSGIPALSKLERRGLIERDKVGGDKRSQYVVRLTDAGVKRAKALVEGMKTGMGTDIELLMSIPCFYCPYIKDCGKGGHVSPDTCELLGRWIRNISKL